jgi:hypothetical protein
MMPETVLEVVRAHWPLTSAFGMEPETTGSVSRTSSNVRLISAAAVAPSPENEMGMLTVWPGTAVVLPIDHWAADAQAETRASRTPPDALADGHRFSGTKGGDSGRRFASVVSPHGGVLRENCAGHRLIPYDRTLFPGYTHLAAEANAYSTVTDFARLRG